VQTPLRQSVDVTHAFVWAHFWHVVPPQSMSVSLAFFTPSLQEAAMQMFVMHTLLWQSLPAPQVLPAPHLVQTNPPQSISLSLPSLVALLQFAV
jgi:hypothetical protein